MSRFLSSIADKAQSAINASPLAGHLPTSNRPSSPDTAAQPSANHAAGQGGQSGQKSHAFESIQHTIRSFGQQYANTSPTQKIITTAKGTAIDFDSVSNDAKAYSKELYTWGQSDAADIKDVSDRLAYLNYVHGSLASSLAVKLDGARSSFKALRDAEASLAPKRTARATLQTQIAKLEHSQQKDGDRKLIELREQLDHADEEASPQEREIQLLKRKALRESEQLKWEALREYGEKLSLLAQAAPTITGALPNIPPTSANLFNGANTTANVRATLQQALDSYQTGHVQLHPIREGADLSRSDTRSFGESHASELSSIATQPTGLQTNLPLTPPSAIPHSLPEPHTEYPQQHSGLQHHNSGVANLNVHSPPIDPLKLNQTPTAIPTSVIPPVSDENSTTSPIPTSTLDDHSPKLAAIQPTVAETGVPIAGGANGPKSGSLKDIRATSPGTAPSTFGSLAETHALAAKFESAEEEKARLAREDRERILTTGGSVPPATHQQPVHDSAEEEKKRLEREERERVLAGQGAAQKKDGDVLPPYGDFQ